MELWNFKGKQNSISEALRLDLPAHAVISVIGAGGKTSLISALAREFADQGRKVAITTTTHMMSPQWMAGETADLYEGFAAVKCGTDTQDIDEACRLIDAALEDGEKVFAFSPDPEKPGKVTAPPQAVLDHVYETADITLIEADGARRMPLKWPAPWEPVVPDRSDFTICVAGLSALGRKTEDVIYRGDHLPERLRRDVVDMNLIHALISSREGGQKDVRGDFRVFLNQIDDDIDRLATAFRLQQILSVLGIQSAWGSLQGDDPGNLSTEGRHEQGETESAAPRIAVILEAAGDSKRFGSNKLMHMMDDGRPMVSRILSCVRGLDPQPYKKVIVTQYDEVAALADGFEVVMNDRPDLGISRSMQLGIGAAGDADAYMFCVCDQPGLTPAAISSLIDAYSEAHKKGTAAIVSLSWQGKMRNPKIFSSRYRDELMALSGDTGGRQIITDHMGDVILVEAQSEDEVLDIDSM